MYGSCWEHNFYEDLAKADLRLKFVENLRRGGCFNGVKIQHWGRLFAIGVIMINGVGVIYIEKDTRQILM